MLLALLSRRRYRVMTKLDGTCGGRLGGRRAGGERARARFLFSYKPFLVRGCAMRVCMYMHVCTIFSCLRRENSNLFMKNDIFNTGRGTRDTMLTRDPCGVVALWTCFVGDDPAVLTDGDARTPLAPRRSCQRQGRAQTSK